MTAAATEYHGLTIVDAADAPPETPFRMSCLCGYLSHAVPDRATAVERGAAHLDDVDPMPALRPEPVPTTFDKAGREVPLPRFCPDWCNTDHAEFVRENFGCLTAAEIAEHVWAGVQGFTDSLHNGADGRMMRPGGAWWSLTIRQGVCDPFDADMIRYASAPLIDVHWSNRSGGACAVQLTTGETRVLAAQLLALCDRVDLSSG